MSRIQIEPYDNRYCDNKHHLFVTYDLDGNYTVEVRAAYDLDCNYVAIGQFLPEETICYNEIHIYVLKDRQEVIDFCYHFKFGGFTFTYESCYRDDDRDVGYVYNAIFPEWVEREKDMDFDGDWIEKEADWLDNID